MITVTAEEMARLLTALRDEYEGSVDELLAAVPAPEVVGGVMRGGVA